MLKVLIADDEKNIREGLTHLIDWNDYGFDIAGAVSNGVEALEFIRRESPDLLITDIRMPDMDGLELIENVRAFNDKIHFIVLSGYNTFSYAQRAMRYNTERYLLKPIEEDDLIECLEKIYKEHEQTNAEVLLRAFLSSDEPPSSKLPQKTVADIVDFVRENYAGDVNLKMLAEKFYMNPRYLGRVFKKSVGISFNTFVNTIRIEAAKKLLRNSDCKVYEIALQVGYNDPNYFSAKFEELEGMPPTQYREGLS